MRPGRRCPGRGRRKPPISARGKSFNEAGAKMPRKRPAAWFPSSRCCLCFNEAGAKMPRKSWRRDFRMWPMGWCFNEAGAKMPRKSLREEVQPVLKAMRLQ